MQLVLVMLVCTVVIRSTTPKKRALNAGDRVCTHVPCAYSQLHAVISTIILYTTFLVTTKTRMDISLRKSAANGRLSDAKLLHSLRFVCYVAAYELLLTPTLPPRWYLKVRS